jgi:8-oxo-dGTP diphosphatase
VVAAALHRADGLWLMHKRPPHKHHGGLWEFPGGKVDEDETPGNALIRELEEELGIMCRLENLEPIAFAEERLDEERPAIVILLYTVRRWQGEPRAVERGAEIGWFNPWQISALERPPLDVMLGDSLFGLQSTNGGHG